MLFLRRLPAAIQLQLTEDDHEDIRALAEKADRCAASIHCHQQPLPIAAAGFTEDSEFQEQEDISISAIGSGRGGRNSCCSRGNGRPFKNRSGGQQQPSASSNPQKKSQQSSGLCFYHYGRGEKALNCSCNCSWQKN